MLPVFVSGCKGKGTAIICQYEKEKFIVLKVNHLIFNLPFTRP